MQSLAYQHNTGIHPDAMINRAQPKEAPDHEKIRDAVRAWSSSLDNQDVVTALIIQEYQAQGGDDITFPDDLCRKRQKLFRFLDNHFNSERYRENVRQLTPAILAVLPIEFRNRLLPEDNIMARLARMEKETSEAKIAVAMDAPRHQKLKELSEGIVEMYRVDPGLTGPLMEMVQMMLGVV
ncbi:regulator [Citrobacter freundii]|uniref:toxin YdaT domain-containing protein n=1 Tax=Citrobacter freundii TaxID=546 RepID=UPI000C80F956|nr:toxin YdaT domain-containing protein [Citrobacter freundii]PMD01355.1 regulator [Citrobacter freundii]WLV36656.1 toxin YdaT domain-containing protein [Citrobacter freundii]HCJ7432710.1 toxin YdaT domain-containing protein [Citrobacter freundii]